MRRPFAYLREINAAEFAKEVEKTGKGLADPQLVKLFAENSAMALDWLTDHGVVFTPQPNSAFRLKRMHGCDKHTGAQYVDVLFQNTKEPLHKKWVICYN